MRTTELEKTRAESLPAWEPGVSSIRVGYVSPTGHLGGAEISLLTLLKEIEPRLGSAVVFCPVMGKLAERLDRVGHRCESLPIGEFSRRHPLRFWFNVRSLAKAVRRHDLNILHANSIYVAEQTFLAARMSRAKAVCHVRDLCPVLGARWLRRHAFNHCDRVVAISQAVQTDLTQKLSVASEQIQIVYNGVDLNRFSENATPSEDFFAGTPLAARKRIGVIGRLSPEKGQECFLRAAPLILRAVPECGFAVVGDAVLGDSRYAEDLGRLARRLSIDKKTVFTGFADGMPSVMASLDIVVVPSDAEPFGRVTIEAMAAGKPVVATNTGCSPEIVLDGRTGLLVPPRCPDALAAAVVRLLRNREMATSMGRIGRRRVAEHFSVESHAEQIARLYRSVLA